MSKIFIGGISPQFTEIQLAELIAIHGEILTVKIIYDKATKKGKGYGFVEMRDPNAAHQVIEALNGTTMGQRELQVSLVPEPQNQDKGVNADLKLPPPKIKRNRKTVYQQVDKITSR